MTVMPNPICLSPLKFYGSIAKQSHRKTYAYNSISPVFAKLHFIPCFQFVVSDDFSISDIIIFDAKTDNAIKSVLVEMQESGLDIREIDDFKVIMFNGLLPISSLNKEGLFYLKVIGSGATYYSEVFNFSSSTKGLIEIEYWNSVNNLYIKNGVVAFPKDFHFKLYLKTEVGKPEYNFEEESTKRLGYSFIESQVSKKIYKFNTVVPEFICDAMRIIRLCNNKIIRTETDKYDAITFEMEAEWQTQGDLASVNCEFETDNIFVNLGGFMPDSASGGDFNNDYNNDFDKN